MQNQLPQFDERGLLPVGDYPLTLDELTDSHLVLGNGGSNWDEGWRLQLVKNLAVVVEELWQAGITNIVVDGSFTEDKDHPNDIDGYFECVDDLASGRLQRDLNLLNEFKVWTWDPATRQSYLGYPKKQLPMWLRYRVELYPHIVNAPWQQPTGNSPLASRISTATTWNSRQRSVSHELEQNEASSRLFEKEADMLKTENEYKVAVQKLTDQQARCTQQRDAYVQSGLKADELERVLAPLRSFMLELEDEIADYESLKRGEFTELAGLRGIGTLLVRMRIASGMTQKQLADKLGVDPSLVSRDERNEYHGVTVDRAARIQEALGFELRSTVRPKNAPVQS